MKFHGLLSCIVVLLVSSLCWGSIRISSCPTLLAQLTTSSPKLIEADLRQSVKDLLPNALVPRSVSPSYTLMQLLGVKKLALLVKSHLATKWDVVDEDATSLPEYLIPGKRYNLVITTEKVYLAELDGSLGTNLTTKHAILAEDANNIVFAGELFVGTDGSFLISNDSGTYRPNKLLIEKASAALAREMRRDFPQALSREKKVVELTKYMDLIPNILSQAQRDLLPPEILPELLDKVIAGEINETTRAQLKEIRRNASHLRDIHSVFDFRHSAYWGHQLFVYLLGEINDKIASERPMLAKNQARLLKWILPKIGMNNLRSVRIGTINEIVDFINWQEILIFKKIHPGKINVISFHQARLALKKIMGFYWVLKQVDNSQEAQNAFLKAHELNQKMGEIHDRIVIEAIQSKSYKNFTSDVDVPYELYAEISNFITSYMVKTDGH